MDLAQTVNLYASFIAFKKTEQLRALLALRHSVIGIFSGNQAGKTSSVAYQYFLRVIGQHPIKQKNLLAKKIRCMSSTLPSTDAAEEQDNTQYLELKKLIPNELIIRDITARSQNLVVQRPAGLNTDKTIFEFRSSKQELQDLGKIQLSSVWHDEETPKRHREECKMRLLAEGGDEIFSLTPISYISYTYDEIWERKSYLYCTSSIVNKYGVQQEEFFKRGNKDVACIQMATDDNPILSIDDIERLFEDIVDPDELAIRRYGVFKQISGRIHKSYDSRICYINFQKTFPEGMPYEWLHTRGIDYHDSRIPWSIGWLVCSPNDEWFLWQEFHPAIDGPNAYSTYDISKAMVRKSLDYEYTVNLIDPLANAKQPNTLFSVTDDLNRYFNKMRTPALWEAWDTKGGKGRSEVAKRFKNAVRCGKPFNNVVRDKGMITRLPTLWICDTCPKFHQSLLNWKFREHMTIGTQMMNDQNPKGQGKFSHDCMVLEGLAKDHRLLYAAHLMRHKPPVQHYIPKSVTGR